MVSEGVGVRTRASPLHSESRCAWVDRCFVRIPPLLARPLRQMIFNIKYTTNSYSYLFNCYLAICVCRILWIDFYFSFFSLAMMHSLNKLEMHFSIESHTMCVCVCLSLKRAHCGLTVWGSARLYELLHADKPIQCPMWYFFATQTSSEKFMQIHSKWKFITHKGNKWMSEARRFRLGWHANQRPCVELYD